MLIEYHRTMIADRPRNAAFRRALEKTVIRGKSRVLDIGAGTGILSFLAAKAGAKEVVMLENGPIASVAEKLLKANGFRNCALIPAHSSEAVGLGTFDIIISETLGNYAFEENIIATLNDAKRFLKPGGAIIPRGLVQYAAPVTSPRFHKELAVWDRTGLGLDFSAARDMSFNNAYVRRFKKTGLLEAKPWDAADFQKKNASTRRGKVSWRIARPATLYGLALWWDCTLAPGITLSTAPDAPKTHWEQLYLPLPEPFAMKRGDTLQAALASSSSCEGGTNLSWSLSLNGKKTQNMDLRKGWLA